MEPKNQERMERWLDKVLAEHGSAEPRPGLEKRVLVRVRQEQEASAQTRSWWPVLAATAAAVALAIGVFMVERPAKAPVTPVANADRQRSPTVAEKAPHQVAVPLRARRPHHTRRDTDAGQGVPKLDQFPSPAPLSEEEEALVRYVKEFPEEARMIAQAQAEYEQELRRKMGKPAETESSDQQER